MIATAAMLEELDARFGDGTWVSKEGQEINVRCPYCKSRGMSEDRSGHLGINLDKNAAHCVRCGWGHRNVRRWLADRNLRFVNDLSHARQDLTKLSRRVLISEMTGPVMQEQEAQLPPHVPLHVEPCHLQSLLDKGLTEDEACGSAVAVTRGKYAGYAVFPFTECGQTVFWQGRAIVSEQRLRKVNPPVEELPLGKSHWVYGYDDSEPDSVAWLCEGTLDQISIKRWLKDTGRAGYAWSLQGTTLSFPAAGRHPLNSQFGKLAARHPSRVRVCLDPDARHKAEALAELLCRCGMDADVVSCDDGDPNEVITKNPSAFTECADATGWGDVAMRRLRGLRR